MRPVTWDLRPWAGKQAIFQIIDTATGPWGNIGVDDIILSDHPAPSFGPLAEEKDFGTLTVALLNRQSRDFGISTVAEGSLPESIFSMPTEPTKSATKPFGIKLIGSLTRKMKLAPGASSKATFVVAWHMPNLQMERMPTEKGRYYATRFA